MIETHIIREQENFLTGWVDGNIVLDFICLSYYTVIRSNTRIFSVIWDDKLFNDLYCLALWDKHTWHNNFLSPLYLIIPSKDILFSLPGIQAILLEFNAVLTVIIMTWKWHRIFITEYKAAMTLAAVRGEKKHEPRHRHRHNSNLKTQSDKRIKQKYTSLIPAVFTLSRVLWGSWFCAVELCSITRRSCCWPGCVIIIHFFRWSYCQWCIPAWVGYVRQGRCAGSVSWAWGWMMGWLWHWWLPVWWWWLGSRSSWQRQWWWQ